MKGWSLPVTHDLLQRGVDGLENEEGSKQSLHKSPDSRKVQTGTQVTMLQATDAKKN